MSLTISLLSDIHYASAAEQERGAFFVNVIAHPVQRLAIKLYRHYFWQRHPFAHNHLLDRFLKESARSDYVIANGDYSCDSGFVGVSDPAAYASAAECLQKLRQGFPARFSATFGDHELGKKPLGADLGGLRLASFYRARKDLEVPPFWEVAFGNYILLGILSTLVALPIFEADTLVEEAREWQELRAAHLEEIRRAFARVKASQRILLFCHDPTALPFLWREGAVRSKLSQIERTIIGHLHSNLIFFKSRLLAGMPVITFLGHTPHRLSSALREARYWRPFKVLLCPSLSGIELLKDGGFYTMELDPAGRKPAAFRFHHLQRGPSRL